MNQTLLLNLSIVALIALGILITGNPLFILALLILPPLPYGLAQQRMQIDMMDDDESQPMGFTQDVKTKK